MAVTGSQTNATTEEANIKTKNKFSDLKKVKDLHLQGFYCHRQFRNNFFLFCKSDANDIYNIS